MFLKYKLGFMLLSLGLMLFITETHSIGVKNFKFRLKTEKNVYLHF